MWILGYYGSLPSKAKKTTSLEQWRRVFCKKSDETWVFTDRNLSWKAKAAREEHLGRGNVLVLRETECSSSNTLHTKVMAQKV